MAAAPTQVFEERPTQAVEERREATRLETTPTQSPAPSPRPCLSTPALGASPDVDTGSAPGIASRTNRERSRKCPEHPDSSASRPGPRA